MSFNESIFFLETRVSLSSFMVIPQRRGRGKLSAECGQVLGVNITNGTGPGGGGW